MSSSSVAGVNSAWKLMKIKINAQILEKFYHPTKKGVMNLPSLKADGRPTWRQNEQQRWWKCLHESILFIFSILATCQPSAVGRWLLVVGHQLSVISCWSSAIGLPSLKANSSHARPLKRLDFKIDESSLDIFLVRFFVSIMHTLAFQLLQQDKFIFRSGVWSKISQSGSWKIPK